MQASDFGESGGSRGYGDSCDSGELSEFDEYDITLDSGKCGDPVQFGDAGDFYEPADEFNETVFC